MMAENVFRKALEERTAAQAAAADPNAIPIGDVPGMALRNAPASAGRFVNDLWQAVSDPVGTAEALGSLGLGLAQQATLDPRFPPAPAHDFRAAPRAAGEAIKDRYGSWHSAKETMATDPVGFLADASAALTGGALAAPRGAAKVASIAGRVADPVGTAVEGAGRLAARAIPTGGRARRRFIEGAPSTAALRGEAGQNYRQAEAANVSVPAESYGELVESIGDTLRREGLDEVLTPRTNRIMRLIERSYGDSPTVADLQITRRQLGHAAGAPEPSDRRLAMIARDALDDFMEGSATEAAGPLRTARGLWQRARKAEVIEDTIERASTRAAGFEAGLRNEFARLARDKRKMRGFSADERAAVRAVADGTATQNMLRRLGSLGGGSGQSRNMMAALLGSGAGGGAGAMLGGPAGGAIGALAIPAAGALAQRMATKGTKRRADTARAMVATGEAPPASQADRVLQHLFASPGRAVVPAVQAGRTDQILEAIMGGAR